MRLIVEKAYAKLNLCLQVGQKADNGYHFIESVMQSVSLCDIVRVKQAADIRLCCSDSSLPTDENNLAYRAALAFFKESGIVGGAHISIDKNIPVCAGLGGGSSDAAAVLRALNQIYGCPLSSNRLLDVAATLGADVPFCVNGGTAYAEGFGEKLSMLPFIKLYYVLITDSVLLSTPQMYKELDESTACEANALPCKTAVEKGDALAAALYACNSFLTIAKKKCPRIAESLRLLTQNGALNACITGKGPTVFGVFTQKAAAISCHENINGSIFCESV